MILKSKRVWTGSQFLPLIISVKDGVIEDIFDYNHEIEIDYDFGNDRILPGFIDVHTHGAYGYDTNDDDPEGLKRWARNIVEEGVTAFLPTTITQTEEVLKTAVRNVANVMKEKPVGAEILGIHFEGPYLDADKRGAQPLSCLQKANVEQFKRYQEASDNNIRLVTVACDLDEGYHLTKYLAKNNIRVTLGHSSANYKQATLAFLNGASSQTHVFNGMTGFHHRDPGQAGFAFFSDDNYGEIICDGVHSTFESLYIFFHAKGGKKSIVITDSMMAKGLGAGEYMFGGEPVIVSEEGHATRPSGSLAGSTANMIDSLRNLIEYANIPVRYAINSCTLNPAEFLGVDNRKGRIKVGFDADMIVISDDYKVLNTFAKGQLLYKK